MGSDRESLDPTVSTLTINGKPYKKHGQHWYEEGNVGFLIGSTAFRLHRSILSRRSPVISDLLLTPQPLLPIIENTNPNDNIIGVLFVELHDRVEDFAHVLDFIYPNSLPAAQTEHLGVKDLMGVVGFTRKYRIDDLKEWAVSKLGADHLLPSPDSSVKVILGKKTLYGDPKFCVELIQFSRECLLPQFLPLACYALATTGWDLIPGDATCLDQLSPEDRNRIHEGRLAVNKAVLEKVSKSPEKIPRRENCAQDDCRPMVWSNSGARIKGLMLHPLQELETRLTFSFAVLCADCVVNVLAQTRTFRDDLMGSLTEFFKLESNVTGTTEALGSQ